MKFPLENGPLIFRFHVNFRGDKSEQEHQGEKWATQVPKGGSVRDWIINHQYLDTLCHLLFTVHMYIAIM